MKKIVLTLITLSSITSVYANDITTANNQVYTNMNTSRLFVEGGLGIVSLKVKNKDNIKLKHKNLFEQNLGLGINLNDKSLITLKLTNLKTYKETYKKDHSIDLKVINLGIDYKHLFLEGHTIRPYINGSIGLTRGKTKIKSMNKVTNEKITNRLSTGFGAGVQANLTNNFVVGLGAEYNYYSSDVTGLNGNAFARYYF